MTKHDCILLMDNRMYGHEKWHINARMAQVELILKSWTELMMQHICLCKVQLFDEHGNEKKNVSFQ